MNTFATLIPIIAAILIAFFSYSFINNFDFSFGKSAASRVGEFAAADRRGLTDKIGDSLVDRLGISSESIELNLRWAQLGGMYQAKSLGSILGQSILFGVAVLGYILLTGNLSPTTLGMLGVAAYYPFLSLKGDASKVREEVLRSLPETASLIAAEMMAGSSAEVAVTRSTALPGSLSRMINDAVEQAQQSGSLLFSRSAIEGVLKRHTQAYRMPQLSAFSSQVDLVASRGSDGPAQMAEVVRGLAREYRSEVTKAAEALDGKLLFPITGYFFIPLLLSVFIPLGVSILQTF